jgi:deferrochelatase/peroxidase EfeB
MDRKAGSGQVHVLLSLHARNKDVLDTEAALDKSAHTGFVTLSTHSGAALKQGDLIHFGYRDGIAQPNVAGLPAQNRRMARSLFRPGAFLLELSISSMVTRTITTFLGSWQGTARLQRFAFWSRTLPDSKSYSLRRADV